MGEEVCNWTPQTLVELVKAVIWPLTIIILGFRFKSGISESLQRFFARNSVSEVSASTNGISAKFVAEKQASELKESVISMTLPESMALESIKEQHDRAHTEFSETLYQHVKSHLEALKLEPLEQVELLSREVSLLQSSARYHEIGKVLFRSQFNLLNNVIVNDNFITKNEVQSYFEQNKNHVGDAFREWDWIKYVSYLITSGLLIDHEGGYKLTQVGRSYVKFMSRNPQFIDDLGKL
ncbi:MAG: hypothetical protein CMK64_06635 [Pseudoalteromonas sp.]|nr:hypothetical protein [Pseudoalteromonas sp.]|tara:strand:- start:2174 stop:2887 length:714 start_codon:yes stop_codon:yes gene_type:complete